MWINNLLGLTPRDNDLKGYLNAIPRLESLADIPTGTPVLIRGDVDAKPGAKVGEGDIRLKSMVDTLKYGQSKGWKQIIFGHLGRKPEGSLNEVAKRLGELLGCDVPLITGWLDDATGQVTESAQQVIAAAKPGSVLMLQNTRAYAIETVLWKAKTADDAARLAPKLAAYANAHPRA